MKISMMIMNELIIKKKVLLTVMLHLGLLKSLHKLRMTSSMRIFHVNKKFLRLANFARMMQIMISLL